MKHFNYTINGNKYEVAVGEKVDNKVEMTVNGEKYTVETEAKTKPTLSPQPSPLKGKGSQNASSAQAPAAATPAAKTAAPSTSPEQGGEPVKAPLPGTIKEVCVAVGDKVEVGQTVIVLEAMKMANNIEAEVAGTVTGITVAVGDSVMADDVMVTIG